MDGKNKITIIPFFHHICSERKTDIQTPQEYWTAIIPPNPLGKQEHY